MRVVMTVMAEVQELEARILALVAAGRARRTTGRGQERPRARQRDDRPFRAVPRTPHPIRPATSSGCSATRRQNGEGGHLGAARTHCLAQDIAPKDTKEFGPFTTGVTAGQRYLVLGSSELDWRGLPVNTDTATFLPCSRLFI